MDYDKVSKIDLDYAFAIIGGGVREYFGYDPLNVKPCDQLCLFHDKIVKELLMYEKNSAMIERDGDLAIRELRDRCRRAEQLQTGDLEAVIY